MAAESAMAPQPSTAPRPWRYIVVGGFNTLVAYGLFALCVLGLSDTWPHAAILVLAHVLGVSFGFVTHGWWVFHQGRPQGASALALAWARSQLSYLGILALGLAINGVLIGGLGWSVWLAQLVATAAAVAVGWQLNRRVIFNADRDAVTPAEALGAAKQGLPGAPR